jgi:hypothetical protein
MLFDESNNEEEEGEEPRDMSKDWGMIFYIKHFFFFYRWFLLKYTQMHVYCNNLSHKYMLFIAWRRSYPSICLIKFP